MNREFLMLAQTFDPDKHSIAGWYASEKLDGQRCFWDGGVSRGRPTVEVPWANLDRTVKPIASGLWSRYGNVIAAANHFLDRLPVGIFLDGELYSGNLQELRSIVAKHVPNENDWKNVRYLIIDSPGNDIFMSGVINNPHFTKRIDLQTCVNYAKSSERKNIQAHHSLPYVMDTFKDSVVCGHEQVLLPKIESEAREELYSMLDGVVSMGGEGIMLRNPKSVWFPKRGPTLLRVKPLKEGDATIIGYIFGNKRLKGMIGGIRVEWKGVIFDIGTGLDDNERIIDTRVLRELALQNPEGYYNKFNLRKDLKIGQVVEFKYVSLTNGGTPREARFKRIKEYV